MYYVVCIFSLGIILCAWLCSVAWLVEIERERRGDGEKAGITEHRAETEIDHRPKKEIMSRMEGKSFLGLGVTR